MTHTTLQQALAHQHVLAHLLRTTASQGEQAEGITLTGGQYVDADEARVETMELGPEGLTVTFATPVYAAEVTVSQAAYDRLLAQYLTA